MLEHLGKAERSSQAALLREATLLCTNYPVLFTEKMLAEVRKNKSANSKLVERTEFEITFCIMNIIHLNNLKK